MSLYIVRVYDEHDWKFSYGDSRTAFVGPFGRYEHAKQEADRIEQQGRTDAGRQCYVESLFSTAELDKIDANKAL